MSGTVFEAEFRNRASVQFSHTRKLLRNSVV